MRIRNNEDFIKVRKFLKSYNINVIVEFKRH